MAGQFNTADCEELELELLEICGGTSQSETNQELKSYSFPETPTLPVLPTVPTHDVKNTQNSVTKTSAEKHLVAV